MKLHKGIVLNYESPIPGKSEVLSIRDIQEIERVDEILSPIPGRDIVGHGYRIRVALQLLKKAFTGLCSLE